MEELVDRLTYREFIEWIEYFRLRDLAEKTRAQNQPKRRG